MHSGFTLPLFYTADKRQAAPKGRLLRLKPAASSRYFRAAFTPK
jgi:hypothetical protein